MNNANKPKQMAGQRDRGVGLDQPPSQAPKPLSMRDLRLHHLDYKSNPEAKALADFYAPRIIEMLKRGKYSQVETKSATTDPVVTEGLTEEDRQALLEFPL